MYIYITIEKKMVYLCIVQIGNHLQQQSTQPAGGIDQRKNRKRENMDKKESKQIRLMRAYLLPLDRCGRLGSSIPTTTSRV